jgi:hypothetical protein
MRLEKARVTARNPLALTTRAATFAAPEVPGTDCRAIRRLARGCCVPEVPGTHFALSNGGRLQKPAQEPV